MTLNFFYTVVFIHVYVSTEEGAQLRWYYDGSVRFGSDPAHCLLLIVATVFYLFFIVPYTIIGTFGSCIVRFHWIHSYLRPCIDTMHAPYKHNKTHWFGLRLLLLQALFTVYITNTYKQQVLVYTIVLSIFLTFQTFCKPYKSKLVSLIDSISILFLVLCLILQIYKPKEELSKSHIQFMTILSLIFLFTIIVHVFMVLKIDVTRTRCYIALNMWYHALKHQFWINSDGYEPVEDADVEDSVRFRESLLAY